MGERLGRLKQLVARKSELTGELVPLHCADARLATHASDHNAYYVGPAAEALRQARIEKIDKRQKRAVKKGDTGEILMRNIEKGGWEALEGGGWTGEKGEKPAHAKDKEIMCFTTRPVESFEVLNDLVVDRGPSPYVSLLELFGVSCLVSFKLSSYS